MLVTGSVLLRTGFLAALVAVATTPLLGWIARRFGILDRPQGYKAHAVPTPLLGGVAVAAGTLGSVLWLGPEMPTLHVAGLTALALGSVIIVLAGLIDDVRGLSPGRKFIWQLAATSAAGLALALLGVRLRLFLHWPSTPIVLLTIIWVVAITNAVNFLDNMNGLCAGLGAIGAAALAAANVRSGEFTVALVAAALAGACIGFLPHNWPTARIFLGDAGSMLIGFLLAALSVMGVYTRGAHIPVLAVFTPLFVLGVEVLDLVLVTLLRLHVGHPPWVGDRRHINHRLVRRGLEPTAAVITLWLAAGACGVAAVLLPTVGGAEAPLLLILLFCALAMLAVAAGTRGLQ